MFSIGAGFVSCEVAKYMCVVDWLWLSHSDHHLQRQALPSCCTEEEAQTEGGQIISLVEDRFKFQSTLNTVPSYSTH